MAQQLFGVDLGLALADGTTEAHVIPVAGAPGGTAVTDAAPKGSLALDITNGKAYIKAAAGAGAANWSELGGAGQNTISWREPAKVWDQTSYGTLADAETAAASGTVDGVTIAAGDRVLLTGLGTGNKNIYIWDGTNYTEDTNAATDGDHTYILLGTSAGKLMVFSGGTWADVHQSTDGELAYIRTFVGKSAAGSELPTFSQNNIVQAGDNLEQAIDRLDIQTQTNINNIAGNTSSITSLQSELDTTQAGAGLDAGGSYTADATTNYLTGATSLKNADSLLDAQIKLASDLLARARKESTATNVSGNGTAVAVATESMATVRLVQWKVYVYEPATGKVNTYEIDAATDGTSVDYTAYAKLRVGGAISGLQVSVAANAGNMELRVATSTNPVTVKLAREVILA